MGSVRSLQQPLLRDQSPDNGAYNSLSEDDSSSPKKENLRVQCTNRKFQGSICFVYTLTAFSAIGGFLFGYDTGVISGAMIEMAEAFDLHHFQQELVVSVTVATAAVFSLASGWISQRFGRKPTIILGSLVFTVGALLMGIAQDLGTLVAGRAVVGVGIGIASMTVPMYIAECAPAQYRGKLVTTNNLFITGGQFIAALTDGVFVEVDPTNGWRYMLGLAGVPSLIQFLGFLFLPESPRWLLVHGHEHKAQAVFNRIHGVEGALHEIQEIKDALAKEDDNRGCLSVFTVQPVRRALFVGCGLQLFQQICGINTVMYYSATIIKMSGIQGASTQIWLASATAASNFVFTIVGVLLVERMGRRWLALSSLAGVTVSLAVLAIAFRLAAHNSPAVDVHWNTTTINRTQTCFTSTISTCDECLTHDSCGFCYAPVDRSAVNGSCVPYNEHHDTASTWGRCNSSVPSSLRFVTDFCPTRYSWITLLGLIIYLMFFAPGMGPMPWTINSEIYPQWARSTCISIATTVNWVFNLIVALTFLSLTDTLGREGAFWLYTGLSGIGLIFVALFVPETKGLSLEEMQELFTR